ncbi:hypothetical protein [Rhodococcus sp. USK10]|uniref:hypothetical protein n=1 Tax=Rhodococcus sp. USK10 TaxID=2789739 RepID=UPI00215188AE|nr:hypothetical protein [Rhodococcus sp. USK10]
MTALAEVGSGELSVKGLWGRVIRDEDLIRATLDDQEPAVQLTRGSHRQTYDELTTFNDDLRGRRDWTDVDLDAALTEEQRQAFEL